MFFRSISWDNISAEDKARLLSKVEDDGEFWMDFEEFSTNFNCVFSVTMFENENRDDECCKLIQERGLLYFQKVQVQFTYLKYYLVSVRSEVHTMQRSIILLRGSRSNQNNQEYENREPNPIIEISDNIQRISVLEPKWRIESAGLSTLHIDLLKKKYAKNL